MKLTLGSTNDHKVEELNALLAQTNVSVASAPEKLDIIEDGESFQENALLKAKGYYDKLKVPTIADDSGLVVECLPDQLGIHSARFAPDLPEYSDKCNKLIELVNQQENRKAYFVCVLCVYLSPDEYYFFEGRLKGSIGTELKGDKGFGYDPVFIPEHFADSGRSFAQEAEWKNEHSHRAKAVHSFRDFFKNRDLQS